MVCIDATVWARAQDKRVRSSLGEWIGALATSSVCVCVWAFSVFRQVCVYCLEQIQDWCLVSGSLPVDALLRCTTGVWTEY